MRAKKTHEKQIFSNWISCRKVFRSTHCWKRFFSLSPACPCTAQCTTAVGGKMRTMNKEKTINRNTMSDRIAHKRVTILHARARTYTVYYKHSQSHLYCVCVGCIYRYHFQFKFQTTLCDSATWLIERAREWFQAGTSTVTVELCLRKTTPAQNLTAAKPFIHSLLFLHLFLYRIRDVEI